MTRARLRRKQLPRDMDASPFSVILAGLIARIPGARAACLVDKGGESVDYAGVMEPFDIKVASAHWQIVLRLFQERKRNGVVRQYIVRGRTGSAVIRSLPDDYCLVVLLARGGGFLQTERAFSACEHALAREAGWQLPGSGRAWFAIHVESDDRRRPKRIIYGGLAEKVEVVGTVVGTSRGERGYRIRLASGPEITVVRERGDFWYAEEQIEG